MLEKLFHCIRIAFLILCFGLPSTWAARGDLRKFDPDHLPILDAFESYYGPFVPTSNATNLYPELQKIAQNLSEANEKITGVAREVKGVYIMDGPRAEVTVLSEPLQNGQKFADRFFITTSTLNRLMASADDGKEKLNQTLQQVAGLFAREMETPFENPTSLDSFNDYMKKREKLGQWRSLNGDQNAIQVMKEAGYPPNAVLKGTESLGKSSVANAYEARNAVKPELNLRRSMLRLGLTADYYQNGSVKITQRITSPISVLKDLKNLNQNSKSTFHPPASVSEAIKRIREANSIYNFSGSEELELNRMILWIDHQLMSDHPPTLTENEIDDLGYYLTNSRSYKIIGKNDFPDLFLDDRDLKYFSQLPDHFEALKKAPFYTGPEWTSYLDKMSKFGIGDSNSEVENPDSWYSSAKGTIAPENLEKVHPGEALKQLRKPASFRSFRGGGPAYYSLYFGSTFQNEVLPTWSLEEKVNHAKKFYENDFTIPFINEEMIPIFTERIKEREKILADPHFIKLKESVIKGMEKVWADRGFWGTYDSFAMHGHMDWPTIWKTLNISEIEGKTELNRAIKSFTQSQDYPRLLKAAANRNGNVVAFYNRASVTETKWHDADLWDYLAGMHNPEIKDSPELLKATSGVVQTFSMAKPSSFRNTYTKELKTLLNRPKVDMSVLKNLHQEVMEKILPDNYELIKPLKTDLPNWEEVPEGLEVFLPYDAWAKEIQDPELLRKIFLNREVNVARTDWFLKTPEAELNRIFDQLISKGVGSSTIDLLEKMKKTQPLTVSGAGMARIQERILRETDQWMKAATTDSGRKIAIERIGNLFADRNRYLKTSTIEFANQAIPSTTELYQFENELLKRFEAVPMTPEEKWTIFQKFATTGPHPRLDQFLFSGPQGFPMNREMQRHFQTALERGQFHNADSKVLAARRVLEGNLKLFESGKRDRTLLTSIFSQINRYIPESSSVKDDLLEQLAFRLDLKGSDLVQFVEKSKSTQVQKLPHFFANLGSDLSTRIAQLDQKARRDFIEYLAHPQATVFPKSVADIISKGAYDELVDKVLADLNSGTLKQEYASPRLSEALTLSRKNAAVAQEKLQKVVLDSLPAERIPAYELLLTSGQNAFIHDPTFPKNVIREMLGYQPGSVEEKVLSAYLRSVPNEEITTTLAYMLSQRSGDKGSILNIFSAFDSLGIKIAQGSHLFDIFGDPITSQLADSKGRNKPLSKKQIEDRFNTELSSIERAKIKRIHKTIGAGSTRTAALVELKDGTFTVALVEHPNQVSKIAGHQERLGRFLEELKKEGVGPGSLMFDELVAEMPKQLAEELETLKEADKIFQAKKDYELLNREMKKTMNGWTFEVPDVHPELPPRPGLLFLNHAGFDLDSWDTLKRGADEKELTRLQTEIGAHVDEAHLRRFAKGRLNTDPHGDNFLFDMKNSRIIPIDHAQTSQYTKDELYQFAQLLKANSEKDVDALAKYGLLLSKNAPGQTVDTALLKTKLQEALAEQKGSKEDLLRMVRTFAEAGSPLKSKFSFGATKGLATLYAEKYEKPEVLTQRIEDFAKGILKKNFIQTLKDGPIASFTQCLNAISLFKRK